jgi:hypothetical protein
MHQATDVAIICSVIQRQIAKSTDSDKLNVGGEVQASFDSQVEGTLCPLHLTIETCLVGSAAASGSTILVALHSTGLRGSISVLF